MLALLAGGSLVQVAGGQQFGPGQALTPAAPHASSLFAADLDGDGDRDVVSASAGDSEVAWFENTDGLGSFWPRQIISTAASGARSVFAADLDGDGDRDVLSASQGDDKIAWYKNTDGLGTFGSQQVITTSAVYAQSVFATDLDGDGDQDVLSASGNDSKIAWYQNSDGLGTFGSQQVITTAASSAWSVFAADLDGDGDQDVLSASLGDSRIAWYENTDGLGAFGPQQIITSTAGGAASVFAGDLDGDGHTDVLSASFLDATIAWYENTDGLGTFGSQQVITSTAAGAISVLAADLDDDGDRDVLSAATNDSEIAWYENTDGLGAFGPPQVISTAVPYAGPAFAADLDGDGDQDVLSTSDTGFGWQGEIAWYENLQAPLMTDVDALSLASGGDQRFSIQAGLDSGLRPYLLLGTLSGPSPGIAVDGLVLPLNPDVYFLYTLQYPNSPTHESTLGTLAANGSGQATFHLPPGLNPALAGTTLHHACAVFDLTTTPGSPFLCFTSNAVPLDLNP